MTRSTRAVAVVVLSVGLAGCGSGSDTVAQEDAATLHKHVATARSALDRGDEAAARAAVADFRAAVRRLTASGDLNRDDAQVLLARADRIVAGIERQEAAEAQAKAAEAQADAEEAAQRALLEEGARGKDKEEEKEQEREKEREKQGKGKGDD